MSALDELRDRVTEAVPEAGHQPHLLAGVEAAMAEVEAELDQLRAERDALARDRSYLGARARELVTLLGPPGPEVDGPAPGRRPIASDGATGRADGAVTLTVAPLPDVATAAAIEYRLGGIDGIEEARLHHLGEKRATIELRLARPLRLAEELRCAFPDAVIHDSPEGLRVELRADGG